MLVRQATPADLARMCRTAGLAFADDPVMRFLFPDDEEFFAGGGTVLRHAMRRWMARGQTWVTDDCVAVAAWVPPSPGPLDLPREPADGTFPDAPDRLARFNAVSTSVSAHTPPEPHWYLNLIGTHPDWQRQGIASTLIRHRFEAADADGLACYLETETPENVAYYRSLGFEVRSEWDVDHPAGPHMWGMLRPPTF